MNPGGMRKCIFTRNGLIHLYIQSRQMAHQFGSSKQLLRLDIGMTLIVIFSYLKCHNHFLQRSISRAFSEPINRTFDFFGSIFYGAEGVGRG
ncbi:hypothetical protein D3C77_506830 [compost metagenome]